QLRARQPHRRALLAACGQRGPLITPARVEQAVDVAELCRREKAGLLDVVAHAHRIARAAHAKLRPLEVERPEGAQLFDREVMQGRVVVKAAPGRVLAEALERGHLRARHHLGRRRVKGRERHAHAGPRYWGWLVTYVMILAIESKFFGDSSLRLILIRKVFSRCRMSWTKPRLSRMPPFRNDWSSLVMRRAASPKW